MEGKEGYVTHTLKACLQYDDAGRCVALHQLL